MLAIVITKVILSMAVIFFVLNMAAILTWAERKQSALSMDRVGPNRASIGGIKLLGLMHIAADAIKMFSKEDFIPANAKTFYFYIAPIFAFAPVIFIFAVIPFGDVLIIGDMTIKLQIADLSFGILFIFAISSLSVYGVILAGWSSGNNYSFLGALRGCAQMISYEVTMGLSIIGIVIMYASLNLNDIVLRQGDMLLGFIPKWGIVLQPLGFILFFTAAIAESKRVPFDLPEGESELVAGYFTEYSSMKFGMFFLAEFAEIAVVAALVTTFFFGGWQVPFLGREGLDLPVIGAIHLPNLLVVLMQVGAFIIKIIFFCWLQLQIRWTLPRFRYDQLMKLGWKYLLPLSLVNIMISALIVHLVTTYR